MKNQNAADTFRGLRSNFGLMMQLLIREGNRGWEHINTDPALYDAVSAADVMRVANEYFTPRRAPSPSITATRARRTADDPLLAGLSDEERQQIRQVRAMLGQMSAEQLNQFLAQAEQMVGQAPPENRDMAEALVALVRQRMEETGGGR